MANAYDIIYECLNNQHMNGNLSYDVVSSYNEMVYADFITGESEYTEGYKEIKDKVGNMVENNKVINSKPVMKVCDTMNSALNGATKVPATIISGEMKARLAKLPVDSYETYNKKTLALQTKIKTGTLLALKQLPFDFVITLPIMNSMRKSKNDIDKEILKNLEKVEAQILACLKNLKSRISSRWKSITKEEYINEIKHADTTLRALTKKMDRIATRQNIKAVKKVTKNSNDNGNKNSKKYKVNTYNGNNKVATESEQFNLSYFDIYSIITENGEITDNTFELVNRIIDTDDCLNSFYEYFTDIAIDIIESSYTYDTIFEKLEYELDNGEITLEDADRLNDFAYEKYILKSVPSDDILFEESILSSIVERTRKMADHKRHVSVWGTTKNEPIVYENNNITDKDYNKIVSLIKSMKTDKVYPVYKKHFTSLCSILNIKPSVIIEYKYKKGEKDKNWVYMRYEHKNKTVDIPNGSGLYHMSPADNIKELKPQFRGKAPRNYFYATPRVYLTIKKDMAKGYAQFKGSQSDVQVTRYKVCENIRSAVLDDRIGNINSGAVYVETQFPIRVEKIKPEEENTKSNSKIKKKK